MVKIHECVHAKESLTKILRSMNLELESAYRRYSGALADVHCHRSSANAYYQSAEKLRKKIVANKRCIDVVESISVREALKRETKELEKERKYKIRSARRQEKRLKKFKRKSEKEQKSFALMAAEYRDLVAYMKRIGIKDFLAKCYVCDKELTYPPGSIDVFICSECRKLTKLPRDSSMAMVLDITIRRDGSFRIPNKIIDRYVCPKCKHTKIRHNYPPEERGRMIHYICERCEHRTWGMYHFY